ncbi:ThiF family adenylyltransferase, partial [Candidatus Woesearchaeota archaeon]|nr:ThiF family adenylyltransferase [Candidatus Woesearchaeota archaeon]
MDYSRQELVIGKEAQNKLGKRRIVLVGLGALGSRVAELLVRTGVGKLVIIDRDIVDKSNLNRQVLYNEKDVNKLKAIAAKNKLEEINPEINIKEYAEDLD